MNRRQVSPPTFKELVSLALPMIASQASETIMLFVDRLFLSWFGKLHIAASMSGGLSFFVFLSFFAGIVGYTNAMVAHYYGAGRDERCVETAAQGFYLSFAFLPLTLLLIPFVHRLFIFVGHRPDQIALEFSYFRILMFGGITVLLRQVLVGFFLGIGKSGIVMKANLIGMFVNIPVNYILIFGKLGFPAMGIRGAALGTIAGSATIFLILLYFFLRHPLCRGYGSNSDEEDGPREPGLESEPAPAMLPSGTGRWRFRPVVTRRLLRFGLPAGAELFLNVFAFNLFVQLMHSMGPDVAAAVTITFNYDMVAFIPMLGLGIAVTSLVGRQMGAGNPDGAKRATYLALRVGYSYALVMMMVFVFGAGALVRVFSGGLAAEDRALVELAKAMIRLAAVYTLADITQLIFAGALRGAGDTRYVMMISVTVHWFLAVGAWILIRVVEAPPLRIWLFFIGFVIILGGVIFLRFRSGRWRDIKVIEEDDILSEIHRPKVKTEAEWM
jgi:multidrug resistance protein, MATE family